MSDTTFLIPVKIDNAERLQNLYLSASYWSELGPVVIYEQDITQKIDASKLPASTQYRFVPTNNPEAFHKTYINNLMCNEMQTPLGVLTDVDFLIPYSQMRAALDTIRQGQADFITPFDVGVFETPFDLARSHLNALDSIDVKAHCIQWPQYSVKTLNQWMPFWDNLPFQDDEDFNCPCGGLFVFNNEKWKATGRDNENIIGWAFDDHERIDRAKKLGFRYARTPGKAYHLKHPRVGPKALFNKSNSFEWMKIRYMDETELQNYIQSWTWNNPEFCQKPVL